MTTYLVWLLLAPSNRSESFYLQQPAIYATQQDCNDVAKLFPETYIKPKCIQARIIK